MIKKKRQKHDKIVLLAKFNLNTIEVVISKALIDSVISQWWICFNRLYDKGIWRNEGRN